MFRAILLASAPPMMSATAGLESSRSSFEIRVMPAVFDGMHSTSPVVPSAATISSSSLYQPTAGSDSHRGKFDLDLVRVEHGGRVGRDRLRLNGEVDQDPEVFGCEGVGGI
jgi:hypothetical protein